LGLGLEEPSQRLGDDVRVQELALEVAEDRAVGGGERQPHRVVADALVEPGAADVEVRALASVTARADYIETPLAAARAAREYVLVTGFLAHQDLRPRFAKFRIQPPAPPVVL
jgi:hypothetical protein